MDSQFKIVFHFRERERKRREAEEERAIEEAISEVREAKRKAAKHRRRRDSLKKDRLGADKEYLVRLVGSTAMKVAELLRKCCVSFCVHRLSSACGRSFVCY